MSLPESGLDLRHVAELARLKLEDAEVALFQPQLAKILGFVDRLKELDVEGVEPTRHVLPLQNVLREDVARPGLEAEQALANAPARVQDLFQVPPVIDS
jgi:aspartyl-tRNA(Asn)/glutamyl-tRNA(Gln) amidotransferase subunit C